MHLVLRPIYGYARRLDVYACIYGRTRLSVYLWNMLKTNAAMSPALVHESTPSLEQVHRLCVMHAHKHVALYVNERMCVCVCVCVCVHEHALMCLFMPTGTT